MSREPSERLNVNNQELKEEDIHYFDRLYRQQMEWTQPTRKHLYRVMNLYHANHILEVGSGTGAILDEIKSINPDAYLVGLDKNKTVLEASKASYKILGTGELLPFSNECFDITLCHYFLLWVKDPLMVLHEMVRVTRIGGWIACLAEPDYGGRLDYPASDLWKRTILASISAPDPFIGRKLRSFFAKLKLDAYIGLQSSVPSIDLQKKIYNFDLQNLEKFLPSDKKQDLSKLKQVIKSIDPRSYLSFMPVFFCIARKI